MLGAYAGPIPDFRETSEPLTSDKNRFSCGLNHRDDPAGFIPRARVGGRMITKVVIATDGSASVRRAVGTAVNLADRFDAAIHALYVVDEGHVESLPGHLHGEIREVLDKQGREALTAVRERADEARNDPEREVTTVVREGRPAAEICDYGREVGADIVASGTRGRHGEHSFLLGSVAENLVRNCEIPVLTVRQLDPDAEGPGAGPDAEEA